MVEQVRRFRFPRSHRLSGQRAFAAVYSVGIRKHAGPLVVYGRPNGRSFARLGLSVSRKVGSAVKRNMIKRRLREAFRLAQHDLPDRYDLVIGVRRHDPETLGEYQHHLAKAVHLLHAVWQKQRKRVIF